MRIHLFVDAENIHPYLFEKAYNYLRRRYPIVKVDIVGKLQQLSSKYDKYVGYSNITFTDCFVGKNSADTFLTAYIVKALYDESLTDGFVIISQDRDLAVAAKFITDYGKQTILVSEVNKTFNNLIDIGANMNLVSILNFEIQRKSKHHIPYFPIPEVQKKNFAYIPKTIFLKDGKQHLYKVHFYNGIKYNLFLNIIPVAKLRRGYSKKTKFRDILKHSYLYVKNDMVFIDLDKILEEENL